MQGTRCRTVWHAPLNCPCRPRALANAAEVTRGHVDKQVAGSEEVASLIRGLERQYDDMTAGRGGGLPTDGARLPTADELGAEFEQYLSAWTDTDEDPSE